MVLQPGLPTGGLECEALPGDGDRLMSRIVVPLPASLARRGLGRALLGGLLALLAACEGGRELAPVAVQARAGAAPWSSKSQS